MENSALEYFFFYTVVLVATQFTICLHQCASQPPPPCLMLFYVRFFNFEICTVAYQSINQSINQSIFLV